MHNYRTERLDLANFERQHADFVRSRELVTALDERQFYAMRQAAAELLQHYVALQRVVGENRDRIVQPRRADSDYRSSFQ